MGTDHAQNFKDRSDAVRELLEAAQFSLTDTGGGVEQFLKADETGAYMIVTNSEGEPPSSLDESCILGSYSPEGDQLRMETFPNLRSAVKPA